MRRTVLTVAALVLALAGCTEGAIDPGRTSGDGGAEAALAAGVGTAAGGAAAADGAGLTVTGVGRVGGTPDTVEATLGVEVRRDTVQEALDAANAGATDLIDALTDAGVDPADVQTAEVSLYPERGDGPEGPEGPGVQGGNVTYVATNQVRVTIDGVDRAGGVLQDALTAAGDAAVLQGLRFSLRDDEQLVARAREAAVADARATAEQYAEAAGVELGDLVGLTETGAGGFVAGSQESAATAADIPLSPGTQDVTIAVTATWSLR